MPLTPEEIEERLIELEESNQRLKRRSGVDNRIPLLATGFDLEDAIFSPSVRITRASVSGNQDILNNTDTSINFSEDTFDTDSMHDTVTNNSRITIRTAGKYLLTASIAFANNGTGRRVLWYLVNGTTNLDTDEPDTNQNARAWLNLSTVWDFAAGDYVEVRVLQTSGGTLTVDRIANRSPIFTATWLAP